MLLKNAVNVYNKSCCYFNVNSVSVKKTEVLGKDIVTNSS